MHLFIIVDILKNNLNKNEFDLSVQTDNDPENETVAQRCVETFHALIHHLYMIHDLVNLCKILTSFKVIQLFSSNRSLNLNSWFNFIEYTKMSTNVADLRLILLNSLTIGIPDYSLDMNQESSLSIKRIQPFRPSKPLVSTNHSNSSDNQKLEISNNLENENLSIMTVTSPNLSQKNIVKSATMSDSTAQLEIAIKNESANSDTMKPNEEAQAKSKFPKKVSRQKSIVELLIGLTMSSINEVYEPLLDNLLDLDDTSDRGQKEYGDSSNMLLINRSILLVDLVKCLDDRFFQENMSLALCNTINQIIIEVTFK